MEEESGAPAERHVGSNLTGLKDLLGFLGWIPTLSGFPTLKRFLSNLISNHCCPIKLIGYWKKPRKQWG